nr:hypothetical protein [Micromonospora sp. U21]
MSCQARAFLESGHLSDGLARNGPVVVPRPVRSHGWPGLVGR